MTGMGTVTAMPPTADIEDRQFDVSVIGGGSAAEALVRELDGSGLSIVVFEPHLVGGECPFLACMPSKSLLHDASSGTPWADAITRRDEIVEHRDDAAHARDLEALGVTLVRHRAEVVGDGVVRSDGVEFHVDHIVIASGSTENVLDVEGVDTCDELVWTSDDAMSSDERPERLLIVGGGVIGVECSFIFSGFGTEVTLIHPGERVMSRAAPEVSSVLHESLDRAGVGVRCGERAVSLRRDGDTVVVGLASGEQLEVDRVLVAIGRHADTAGLGLESIGVDGAEPLPLEPHGRVRCDGSVWAIGDVSGHGQYTHLANHHARVVADHLAGTSTRVFDDVTQVGCVFSTPPLIEVGPSWEELRGDDDVVATGLGLGGFPRADTDELGDGYLWLAARRSTGCLVAASGIGPKFDELVHAIVIAVDGAVPVARLQMSMQPFPTIGEILGPILRDLDGKIADR